MDTPEESRRELREEYLTQRTQQARARPKGGGCLANLAKMILFLILAVAFILVFDYMDAPWSWDLFGHPTLTGEWVGTFKLPAGQAGAAYLNLTHNHDVTYDVRDAYSLHNLPPFDGTARGCLSVKGIQNYKLYGGATSSGKDVEMSLQALKPTIPNYALHELKGAWDGTILTLSGTFTTIVDAAGSTLVKSEPNQTQPTTILFHKGTSADFEKACETLGP